MSCSYSDIAVENHFLKPTVWKRFHDDIFVIWIYGHEILYAYLNYLNDLDVSKKIQFTIPIGDL